MSPDSIFCDQAWPPTPDEKERLKSDLKAGWEAYCERGPGASGSTWRSPWITMSSATSPRSWPKFAACARQHRE